MGLNLTQYRPPAVSLLTLHPLNFGPVTIGFNPATTELLLAPLLIHFHLLRSNTHPT